MHSLRPAEIHLGVGAPIRAALALALPLVLPLTLALTLLARVANRVATRLSCSEATQLPPPCDVGWWVRHRDSQRGPVPGSAGRRGSPRQCRARGRPPGRGRGDLLVTFGVCGAGWRVRCWLACGGVRCWRVLRIARMPARHDLLTLTY